jgi:endonuclease III
MRTPAGTAPKPRRKRSPPRGVRESAETRRLRAREIIRRLARAYPDARCSLEFRSPLELLVATVLSAQCTDARVNKVTPVLFRKYRTAADYARSPAGELEQDIRSTGFYNSKARSLRSAGAAIARDFGGRVPDTMEGLLSLPGVGRKTANVILGNAFGKAAGMVVDTHIGRIARRLGLTRNDDPVRIEEDLNAMIPPKARAMVAHRLIFHGRQVCTARRPKCEQCPLEDLCPRIGVR